MSYPNNFSFDMPYIAAAFHAHFSKSSAWPQGTRSRGISDVISQAYPLSQALEDLANVREELRATCHVLVSMSDFDEAIRIGDSVHEGVSVLLLELRALETAVKMAGETDASLQACLRPVSLAREAARVLQDLLQQMTGETGRQESNINLMHLRRLAEHGTRSAGTRL
ncbi:hypothetical protein [Type-D symbiont of Plautia stali]|uniref:hypothetical protein n=1 Tax=Type-D symbiont of Plautia stali TaxID=1560356 RepID=UPI00073F3CD8|nr:hypothetical protein [Type-D symbiont of Plautia stali]